MDVDSLPSLPPEVWLQILRYATLSTSTPISFAIKYHPFQASTENDIDPSDSALHVKAVVARVCKRWKELSTDLLYEDIILHRSSAKQFRELLQNTQDAGSHTPEINKMVHRVLLPYSSSVPQVHSTPSDSVEFLRECHELKILVRPGPWFAGPLQEFVRYEFPAEPCPPLTSLQRLDWWHNNDASRTGGINSLPEVVLAAPNLKYLTLAGDVWLGLLHTPPVELAKLTTLRLRRVNVLFIQLIGRWTLPSLDTLILDTAASVYTLQGLLEVYAEQLRSVELGKSLAFTVHSVLQSILDRCNNLKQLNYYIYFVAPPDPDTPISCGDTLETVGLHAHRAEIITNHFAWSHLQKHLQLFSQPAFTRLKRVLLYGDWDNIISDPLYPKLVQKLVDRGCVVERAPEGAW
ncbi:hypothetical protein NLI96_g226 [Meripilus lineatus]|uniref:F-box domain-containing protein n=1 Tax=Meripilus lineatus TaxID=2056292 RepID=A0AAD5VCU5_9APHY|nr:hypothetical protein NLI96_g226 [Physisporinus lineatus]